MKKHILGVIAIILYIVITITDKIIHKIPDYIYIPLALLVIVLLMIDLFKKNKNI